MVTQLEFIKNEKDTWEVSFDSNGNIMGVQINRKDYGTLLVYGNINGMAKVLLENLGPGADRDQLLEINVPAGIKITIESFTEVISAKYV